MNQKKNLKFMQFFLKKYKPFSLFSFKCQLSIDYLLTYSLRMNVT